MSGIMAKFADNKVAQLGAHFRQYLAGQSLEIFRRIDAIQILIVHGCHTKSLQSYKNFPNFANFKRRFVKKMYIL